MRNLYMLLVFITISAISKAQDTNNTNKILSFEASYTGDFVNNFSGGLKKGSAYLGMANVLLNLDLQKAGIWKNSSIYINAVNTHGSTPTAVLFGDAQGASNIEAGNHTYIQELYFKHKTSRVEFTIGLQDLNVEFANSDNALIYLNSSFGVIPIISGNLAAPIFPLTSPGITVKWDVTDELSWLNAVYDGCPTDFERNPYNIKWELASGDGLLAISEIQHKVQINKLNGIYKIGVYNHNHIIQNHLGESLPDSLNLSTYGFYLYADQDVWNFKDRSIALFFQYGYSSSVSSVYDNYIGAGCNLKGMFSKSKDDILGLSVAYGHFKNSTDSETAIELTWKKTIYENMFLQPDLQYIITPSGKKSKINNCFAGILRLGLSF